MNGDTHESLPPTTTAEQDLRSASQRHINRIWEFTQALIAVTVIISVMYAVVFRGESLKEAALIFLTNVAMVVVGFYFGRTNHQRSGGIGGEAAGAR